jgi:hypothetical protein
MGSMPLTAAFAALNGMEMKKILLKEIERQLDADSRFSQHLTYARIDWRWKLATDSYPAELGQIKIDIGGTILAPEREGVVRREIPETEQPMSKDYHGGSTVAAPVAGDSANEARRKAGLPIPTTRQVRGIDGARMTVDAVEVPHPERESQDTGSDSPQVVTNKPSGKGVLARSAAIKTRANTKGLEVAPKPGTPQTAADAEKIIENGLADGTLEERDAPDSTED